jgi:hypothetical protein
MKNLLLVIVIYIIFNSINLKAQNPEWIVYTYDSVGLNNDNNYVFDIWISPNNNKWVSGFNRFLIFNNQSWHIISGPYYNDIFFRGEDTVYLAGDYPKMFTPTDTLLLNTEEDTVVTNFGDTITKPKYTCWALGWKDGNLWLGTRRGLVKYDGSSFTEYDSLDPFLQATSVWFLKIDSKNNLWIGTDSGIVKYDGVNFTNWTVGNSPLPGVRIHSLVIDKFDNIWLTMGDMVGQTHEDHHPEIVKFDGTNWAVYDSLNVPVLPKYGIATGVCIDSSNVKWITTSSGLYKFDDTTWTHFDTTNSGLPSNIAGECECDRDGNVWIATVDGLAVYREGGVILSGVGQYQGFSPMTIFFPNPAEKSGKIHFELLRPERVDIVLYTNEGKLVKTILNEYIATGEQTVNFSTSDLPPGTYFYKFKAGNRIETKKFVVVR